MTRALVGEIKTFIDTYNKEGVDQSFVENTSNNIWILMLFIFKMKIFRSNERKMV